MFFRNAPRPRILRLIAALVVAALGGGLLSMFPFVGAAAALAGLGFAVYQGVQIGRERERQDPYDLSRLWEREPEREEPEEDGKHRNLVLCHRCGASMSDVHAICPQCGNFLGT